VEGTGFQFPWGILINGFSAICSLSEFKVGYGNAAKSIGFGTQHLSFAERFLLAVMQVVL
jgi:hypothetical protein